MAVTITREQPDSADATVLITELDEHLTSLYPSESRHGLNIERLIAEAVPFFVIRSDNVPAGCGAIKLMGDEYGELKRMYVRPQFRGRGLAQQLIDHLAVFARDHGVPLLRLETGIYQGGAIRLYERAGFYRIAPFGPYFEDPLSLCYEKRLG